MTARTATPARTVPAWDAPDAPMVTVERRSGTGPRRAGDTYLATTADGRTLGLAKFHGRRGGHDVWVVTTNGRTSSLYGALAFLTQQYGTAPDA